MSGWQDDILTITTDESISTACHRTIREVRIVPFCLYASMSSGFRSRIGARPSELEPQGLFYCTTRRCTDVIQQPAITKFSDRGNPACFSRAFRVARVIGISNREWVYDYVDTVYIYFRLICSYSCCGWCLPTPYLRYGWRVGILPPNV